MYSISVKQIIIHELKTPLRNIFLATALIIKARYSEKQKSKATEVLFYSSRHPDTRHGLLGKRARKYRKHCKSITSSGQQSDSTIVADQTGNIGKDTSGQEITQTGHRKCL